MKGQVRVMQARFIEIHLVLAKKKRSDTFKSKRKIRTWTGIWTSDHKISSLALYYSSNSVLNVYVCACVCLG